MISNASRPTLSDDLIYCIFTFLPNFEALRSTLRASKTFYTVFEAHPQSIVRDIAFNQFGPALPQALRLVRCQSRNYEPAKLLEVDVVTHPPITPKEARMLAFNARVVRALEDLFSWR
jgi:hypothetical protein